MCVIFSISDETYLTSKQITYIFTLTVYGLQFTQGFFRKSEGKDSLVCIKILSTFCYEYVMTIINR